jgi:hypothetical protein
MEKYIFIKNMSLIAERVVPASLDELPESNWVPKTDFCRFGAAN